VVSMQSALKMVTVQSADVHQDTLVTHLFAVTLTPALRILAEPMPIVTAKEIGLCADADKDMREIHF